jgi:hypothetical protein
MDVVLLRRPSCGHQDVSGLDCCWPHSDFEKDLAGLILFYLYVVSTTQGVVVAHGTGATTYTVHNFLVVLLHSPCPIVKLSTDSDHAAFF